MEKPSESFLFGSKGEEEKWLPRFLLFLGQKVLPLLPRTFLFFSQEWRHILGKNGIYFTLYTSLFSPREPIPIVSF